MNTTPSNHQLIPAGYVPVFGYVEMERVRIAFPGPLHLPAVVEWHRIIAGAGVTIPGPGAPQPFNAPSGYWEEREQGSKVFVLTDGRHRYAALWIAGYRVILARWLEKVADQQEERK